MLKTVQAAAGKPVGHDGWRFADITAMEPTLQWDISDVVFFDQKDGTPWIGSHGDMPSAVARRINEQMRYYGVLVGSGQKVEQLVELRWKEILTERENALAGTKEVFQDPELADGLTEYQLKDVLEHANGITSPVCCWTG